MSYTAFTQDLFLHVFPPINSLLPADLRLHCRPRSVLHFRRPVYPQYRQATSAIKITFFIRFSKETTFLAHFSAEFARNSCVLAAASQNVDCFRSASLGRKNDDPSSPWERNAAVPYISGMVKSTIGQYNAIKSTNYWTVRRYGHDHLRPAMGDNEAAAHHDLHPDQKLRIQPRYTGLSQAQPQYHHRDAQ